jgi:manganese/iron transport system ATP-binding protein
MHPIEPAHLDLQNVSVAYNGHLAIEDFTLRVSDGEKAALVGPNGAGKTTLFKAILGLIPLRSGSIKIHSTPMGLHSDCIAYIPQREEVDWHFPVTVEDVVMMGRIGKLGWFKRPGSVDRALVHRSMEQMMIADLAHRPIGRLSGGQQQRVFLARALAQEPHILLLDEPFTGVDIATQEVTLDLLSKLQAQQVTIIISTHDLHMAATRFDRVILLNRRLVAYGTPSEVLTPLTLRSAFGEHMLVMPNGEILVDDCCPHDDRGVRGGEE